MGRSRMRGRMRGGSWSRSWSFGAFGAFGSPKKQLSSGSVRFA